MKTIGLIGGMSWESTASYYRVMNELVKSALGGLHSARVLLNSLDFAPLEVMQREGNWDGIAEELAQAAGRLEQGGADFILMGTNTMHRVFSEVEQSVRVPVLHIADATAEVLLAEGVRRVGLLGTSFTMEQSFYKGRLAARHGLEVLTPEPADRKLVHGIIFQELCQGRIREESRQQYLGIMERLTESGAEAIVLGCTEIGLLVTPDDTDIPLYDTARIHAAKAVEWALRS
ncbi:aspartate/glutamate racemase family protein [Marinobacter salinisoli]|uniref:Aspartate/glutamate racemase family protein n=1 Tax=Marinobacter salinisoli TaxID=2769486 RepID=A0ABX7MW48_9GAMM|nr:aspartate/glutamate racemase family protein [Marinobacter salinisoli]QSP96364.1 aspartate/glutamate racemase family protein [Marinobacter salinisoli]